MSEQVSLTFAARSDIGRRRQNNEDTHLVDEELRLFVVCDGMGGHAAGEIASDLAARTLLEHVRRHQGLIQDYACGQRDDGRIQILEMLEMGVNLASSRIWAQSSLEPEKRGMGTTLVATLLVGPQAFIVHVGDSRLYLLRAGKLEQVTEDHNAYNELVKRRGIPVEQVADLVKRNRLTRAVGLHECVEPDTLMLDVADGDRLLLCSDGLSRYFENDGQELARILGQEAPDRAATTLIATANERGGHDNVTVVVLSIRSKADEWARVSRISQGREMLARVPIFRRLDEREQLHILQIMEVVKTKPGEVVIREGEEGDRFFIPLQGSFRVERNLSFIRTLGPGEHFGEIALIRDRPRTASVISEKDGEILTIRRDDFYAILRKKHRLAVKILWAFARTLASRLEETQQTVEQLRDDDDLTGEFFRPME